MRNRSRRTLVCVLAGLMVAVYGWCVAAGEGGAATPLDRAAASRVTGGDTTCPSLTYSTTTACPYSNLGTCSFQNFMNGQACNKPPSGGDYACQYDCSFNGAATSGSTQANGTITSTPCPSVMSNVCTTATYSGGTICYCAQLSGYVAVCSANGGNYQKFNGCAQ